MNGRCCILCGRTGRGIGAVEDQLAVISKISILVVIDPCSFKPGVYPVAQSECKHMALVTGYVRREPGIVAVALEILEAPVKDIPHIEPYDMHEPVLIPL